MQNEPNMRQKKTLEVMLDNGGKMSPAMKEAGYGEGYAKNPNKLATTKTWKQLVDERLSDDKLSRVLDEGLEATNEKGRADFFARHRYVETSLKVRNKLVEHHDLTSEGEKIGGFVVVKTVPASKEEDGKPVPVE
jgi:hypothetical protein